MRAPRKPAAGSGGGRDRWTALHLAPASALNEYRANNRLRDNVGGNSHHYQTRESLKRLLDGRGVDLLFIDGDHSYGGVRADFEMYGDLVGRNGLIAFHDITGQPDQAEGFDVGKLWSELKSRYQVSEIIDERGTLDREDWDTPQAWGIGLLTRW